MKMLSNDEIIEKINNNLLTEKETVLIALLNLPPRLGRDITVKSHLPHTLGVDWDVYKYQIKDGHIYGWFKSSLV